MNTALLLTFYACGMLANTRAELSVHKAFWATSLHIDLALHQSLLHCTAGYGLRPLRAMYTGRSA
jgi:hypothetical protein